MAIVEAADSALRKKKGECMDLFDIVIRIKQFVIGIFPMTKYLGRKIDVLYHSL